MPFLEICDEGGNISREANLRLFATMTYPGANQAAERELMFQGLVLRGVTTFPSNVRVATADRNRLREIELIAHRNFLRNRIGLDTFENQESEQAAKGMIAGLMLRFLLRCVMHSPKNATLGRAYYFMNGICDRAEQSGAKIGIGFSKPVLRDYFGKDHAADCHLHAAVLACEIDGVEDWFTQENISTFLDISEVYRFAGETAGFLNPTLMWRPPPHYQISDLPLEILERLVPPLNAEELSLLGGYTARWEESRRTLTKK
jgi:hypothetical protein